jgi:hypothetical protein
VSTSKLSRRTEAEVGQAKARDGGGVDAIFEMIASSAAISAFAMTAKSRSISILVLPSLLEGAA